MQSYKSLKNKLLTDPEIAKEYQSLEPEYKLIREIIKLRIDKGLTQNQLAKMVGTKQSAISRLESGSYNPTILMLKKISLALDSELSISIS